MRHESLIGGQIKVNYEYTEGHHVFTSDEIKGLLVVHKDFRTAYGDVAPVLEHLLAYETGHEYKVYPLIPIDELIDDGEVPTPPESISKERMNCAAIPLAA